MENCFCFAVVLAMTAGLQITADQANAPVGNLPLAQVQRLADSGDPAAENELGVRYRIGADVEKNPAKAVSWYLKAARQGDAKAYFNLGAAYYNGDSVPVNTDNSCAYFIFSSDAGDERGAEALARTRSEEPVRDVNKCEVLAATAYMTGDLIKQDYGKAMRWYRAAADAGDRAACEKLAYMYDRGLGVPIDQAEKIKWLQRAADLNYAPAAYELGMVYETGQNVTRDLVRARKLYEQASYLSVTQAFTALGRFYDEGLGIKVDRNKALAYYIVAASSGDPAAKQKVDQISAQMSPKQIAAAKQNAAKLAGFTRSPVLLLHK